MLQVTAIRAHADMLAVAKQLETLVAARYGGEAPADAQAASQALVDELEREFVSKEPRT